MTADVPTQTTRTGPRQPDRNLALELVRTTEAAAMSAARWTGRGEKNDADRAAVDAMRLMLGTVSMDGTVVIGEGEKDEAPMLFNGEKVGSGHGPGVDVAVDPLEGTTLAALGLPNAISVIALAERGTMFFPGPATYMDKIVTGREAADVIDIEASPAENVDNVAAAKSKKARDITVVVLDRPRNHVLIAALRAVGARITLIQHGDTAPAIAAAIRHDAEPVDLVMGIGEPPEGVITAAAVKCVGGAMHGRLWANDDAMRRRLDETGYDVRRVLRTDDLVSGDDVFVAATGVTSGALLHGVRYTADGAITESIVMRSRSGTVRRIIAEHSFDTLDAFAAVEYH